MQDVRGGSLPSAPKYRVNFTPRYEDVIPETGVRGFVQLGINYYSRQQFAIEQDPLLVQKAYALVDATLGVRTMDDRYTVSLFARDLFDRHYVSSIAHTSTLATAANAYDLAAFINKDADRYVGIDMQVKF
jgi:iron complex outermembrane receptor protein